MVISICTEELLGKYTIKRLWKHNQKNAEKHEDNRTFDILVVLRQVPELQSKGNSPREMLHQVLHRNSVLFTEGLSLAPFLLNFGEGCALSKKVNTANKSLTELKMHLLVLFFFSRRCMHNGKHSEKKGVL